MFTFLHAADIHLDSPLRGLERYPGAAVDQARSATRLALKNLVSLAIDKAVDFVVIAGDIYDGDWKDHNTGLYFVAQMSRLRSAGIPVIMIAGNHDAANKMTRSLHLPDNVEMLSTRHAATASNPNLERLGVAVHGRSFAHAAETSNLVPEYPRKRSGMFNIGVLHTALDGAEGHDRYAPCSLQDLHQKDYDYWALGHVHHRQVVCRSPYVVFSGNIQGRHIRELGPKGCYLVNVDNTGSVSLQFEPLDVMRWQVCQLDLTPLQTPDELLNIFQAALTEQVQQQAEMPLALRVVLSGTSSYHDQLLANTEHWSNQFRSAAFQSSAPVWVEKVKFETTPPHELSSESLVDGPIGQLLQCYQELRGDATQLHALEGEWQELFRKLPYELLHDTDGLKAGGMQQVQRWLDEAVAIITSRLGVGRQA